MNREGAKGAKEQKRRKKDLDAGVRNRVFREIFRLSGQIW